MCLSDTDQFPARRRYPIDCIISWNNCLDPCRQSRIFIQISVWQFSSYLPYQKKCSVTWMFWLGCSWNSLAGFTRWTHRCRLQTGNLTPVQCRYNAVNFIQKIHRSRPLGRGMGCLIWISLLIDILPQFLQWHIQYRVKLSCVITVHDCSKIRFKCILSRSRHNYWGLAFDVLSVTRDLSYFVAAN